MGASSYVSAGGTGVFTGATVAVAQPSTKAAGDVFVLVVASISGTPTISGAAYTAGWMQALAPVTVNGWTVAVFAKAVIGSESGNITVTATGNTQGVASMFTIRPDAAATLDPYDLVVATGADTNTASSAFATSAGSIALSADDFVSVFSVLQSASGNYVGSPTAEVVSHSTVTLGSTTRRYGSRFSSDLTKAYDLSDAAGTGASTTPTSGTLVFAATGNTAASSGASVFIVARQYPIPGSDDWAGSAAVSGAGTLAAAGSPGAAGTAASAGAGALTGVGTPAAKGTRDGSGAGTVALTGKPGVVAVRAASGAGALTVDGKLVVTGAIPLSAAGAAVLAGKPGHTGAAVESGSGALTTAGTPGHTGTRAGSGAGALALAGPPAGTRAATGSGALTAAGKPGATGTRPATGAGALAASGKLAASGPRALAGDAQLALTGKPNLKGARTLGTDVELDVHKFLDPGADPSRNFTLRDLHLELDNRGWVLGESSLPVRITSTPGDWIDVLDDFTRLTVQRGVSLERGIFFAPDAGTLELETESLLAADEVYNRTVRLRYGTTVLFTGRVNSYEVSDVPGDVNTPHKYAVKLTAEDAVGVMARTVESDFDVPEESGNDRAARLGIAMIDSLDNEQPARSGDNPTRLGLAQDVANANRAKFYVDALNRAHMTSVNPDEPEVIFTDTVVDGVEPEYAGALTLRQRVDDITTKIDISARIHSEAIASRKLPSAVLNSQRSVTVDLVTEGDDVSGYTAGAQMLAWVNSFPLRGFTQLEPVQLVPKVNPYNLENALLGIELCDLIAVRREGHLHDAVVLRIAHTITPRRWSTNYGLAPGYLAQTSIVATPGPATSFRTTSRGPDFVQLDWNAPQAVGSLSGYRLYGNGGALIATLPANATSYLHTGLSSRTDIAYALLPITPDPGIVGPVAGHVSWTTSKLPGTPTGLTITAGATASQKHVLWSRADPPNDVSYFSIVLQDKITGERRYSGNYYWAGGFSFDLVWNDLPRNREFWVSVVSSTDPWHGETRSSAPAEGSMSTAEQVPSAPTSQSVSKPTTTSMLISWAAPFVMGPDFEYYNVRIWDLTAGGAWAGGGALGSGTFSFVQAGLPRNHSYRIEVTAVTKGGLESALSTLLFATTAENVPAAPYVAHSKPGTDVVTLAWDGQGATDLDYFELSIVDQYGVERVRSGEARTTGGRTLTLPRNLSLTAYVTPITYGGMRGGTGSVSFTTNETLPSAPAAFAAGRLPDNRVNISYSSPSAPGPDYSGLVLFWDGPGGAGSLNVTGAGAYSGPPKGVTLTLRARTIGGLFGPGLSLPGF